MNHMTKEYCEIYYSQEYDALLCLYCDVWLEETCKDERCEVCKDRPLTPNEWLMGK